METSPSLRAPLGVVLLLALCALPGCPEKGVAMLDPDMMPKDGGPRDGSPNEDTGTTPADVQSLGPPCTPRAAVMRTDPCMGRPDCGLPSHGRVDVMGARTMLTDFQVEVTLPMPVRAAVGAMCDRIVFRSSAGAWAPHFVTDCAMGKVWVRVPQIAPGSPTVITMHYGGSTAVAAAQSYDETFDRVPTGIPGMLGAYSFDEGRGTRTCPADGTVPFDAYLLQAPYRPGSPSVRGPDPVIWSTPETPAPQSILAPNNPAAHFSRSQFSLNFPVAQVVDDPTMPALPPHSARPINWRSLSPAPFNTATRQLTVAIWARPESPANNFNDNFQTVVCFGMPDQPRRAMHWRLPETDPRIVDNAIFNPWAVFFRGDAADDTLYQGNTCVEPCLDVISYAHITTREPQTGAAYVRKWHFLAFTFDSTVTPHTLRRSYYDNVTYNYPADLELFPQDRTYCPMPLSFAGCNPAEGARPTCPVPCAPLCPGGRGPCIYPPEAPIAYPPAPVVIGADLNSGEAELGLHGQIDDMFIMNRALGTAEMQAYREHRRFSPDPITSNVTP